MFTEYWFCPYFSIQCPWRIRWTRLWGKRVGNKKVRAVIEFSWGPIRIIGPYNKVQDNYNKDQGLRILNLPRILEITYNLNFLDLVLVFTIFISTHSTPISIRILSVSLLKTFLNIKRTATGIYSSNVAHATCVCFRVDSMRKRFLFVFTYRSPRS